MTEVDSAVATAVPTPIVERTTYAAGRAMVDYSARVWCMRKEPMKELSNVVRCTLQGTTGTSGT